MLDKLELGVIKRVTNISIEPEGKVVYLYKEKFETTSYFNNAFSAAKFEIGCDGTFNMKDLKKFCVNCLTFINLDNLDDTAAKDLCVKLHKFAVNIQKDPFPVL